MVTIAADASLRVARGRRRAHFTELAHRRVGSEIATWPEFFAAAADRPMLAKLDDYRDSLLITGCDWPAVTAITHLFKRLSADFAWGSNDELDGALLLAGLSPQRRMSGRAYFQTTYLGERYREYLAHENFKLVWIVREPHAAVHSLLSRRERDRARRPPLALSGYARAGGSRLEKACAAYTASIRQMLELKERLGERVAVVDYDELSTDRTRLLPALCRFASVAWNASLLRHLHGKRKGTLAEFESAIVDQLAMPAYRRARCAGTLSIVHG